jgi:hypothetical protein
LLHFYVPMAQSQVTYNYCHDGEPFRRFTVR